jgi:hypothetical protein
MYRLQGATHFIFYNHTVGPDVESILNRYIELGIVSTLTWNLPLNSKKDIRTEAIFTAINDCNMRAAWLFEYLGQYEFFFKRYVHLTNKILNQDKKCDKHLTTLELILNQICFLKTREKLDTECTLDLVMLFVSKKLSINWKMSNE